MFLVAGCMSILFNVNSSIQDILSLNVLNPNCTGKVTVELADFDFKLQTNLLCMGKKMPIPAEMFWKSF